MRTRSRHSQFIHMLDTHGTLKARAPQGLRASLKGVACLIAIVIGIALSIGSAPISYGSIDATRNIKILADKQLTKKQYICHNEIVYRESRWNYKAIGNIGGTKQAYGLYQLKIKSLRIAHPEIQFWKYWEYVSYRYGITEYDEPNYCGALHHLQTKGWQ
jgi:hypothetical protein